MSGSAWQEEQAKSPFQERNKIPHVSKLNYQPIPQKFMDTNATSLCCMCKQRMKRLYREDWVNGGWLRVSGFFQVCLNPDCILQYIELLADRGDHRFRI